MNNQDLTEILLVEENDQDAELITNALRQDNLVNQVFRLKDGQEVLDYFGNQKYKNGILNIDKPKLILLDFKQSGIDGLEVLKILKSDDKTKLIPVVVLYSSAEKKELQTCYKLGVNSIISKPGEPDNFLEMVRTLGLYWLLLNRVP